MTAGGERASDHGVAMTFTDEPTHWADEAVIEPEPWTQDALCAQTDPELFFPEKGGSTRDAKRICRDCQVVFECLAYALQHEERFGIWGGKSERERRRIRRVSEVRS